MLQKYVPQFDTGIVYFLFNVSVIGIVLFPFFTWLFKYKEEYKQEKMWHSAQKAEISEEICMFQRGRFQATGTWLISAETNNEELLIARQRFRNDGYIDGVGYKRKATDNFAAEYPVWRRGRIPPPWPCES
jgi:hypothetical protein